MKQIRKKLCIEKSVKNVSLNFFLLFPYHLFFSINSICYIYNRKEVNFFVHQIFLFKLWVSYYIQNVPLAPRRQELSYPGVDKAGYQ